MEFTEQERHAIDDIYKREFKDLTPDEVQLYARWESFKAATARETELLETEHMKRLQAETKKAQLEYNLAKARFDAEIERINARKWGEDGKA